MYTNILFRWRLPLGSAATAACLALFPAAASADVFELTSGGRVIGELLNEKEIPRVTYDVKTPTGIVVSLERAAVKKQEKQRPALEEYAEVKPTYPDTVEGQMALADWCRQHHLYAPRNAHLERVIELEPNHVEARRMLGHLKVEGKWVTPDESMSNRGYIQYRGRWRLPQEIEAMTARDKREKAEREWFAKIERWKKSAQNGSREDYEHLRGIDDPLALRALGAKLRDEPAPGIRVLYLEAVNTIGGPGADMLLGQVSLYDNDREVRLSAMDYLTKTRPPEVVMMYMKALRNTDPKIINRAGAYLGALGAEGSVPALIDALVSAHKFQVTYGNPGGGMSTTFSKGGSGGAGGSGFGGAGMSMGSQTVIETVYNRNEDVLNSLVSLTKQNFGYDMAAWKAWYSQQAGPQSLDNARRD